jgi:hypothetical protein
VNHYVWRNHLQDAHRRRDDLMPNTVTFNDAQVQLDFSSHQPPRWDAALLSLGGVFGKGFVERTISWKQQPARQVRCAVSVKSDFIVSRLSLFVEN